MSATSARHRHAAPARHIEALTSHVEALPRHVEALTRHVEALPRHKEALTRHDKAVPPSRRGRTPRLACAAAAVVAVVSVAVVSAGAVAPVTASASANPVRAGHASNDAGSDPRIFFGVVGDQSLVQPGADAVLGEHSYGQIAGRVPPGRMVTMGTSGRSYAAIAAAGPGSAVFADIVRWADTIKARGATVLFGFAHEPEASKQGRLGGPGPYIAAYRHVVDVFRDQGVGNVEYVWQMTDFSFSAPAADPRQAAKWYPGDAYVDGVGADAYNWYDCGPGHGKWRALSIAAAPALAFARAHGKKLVLPEFGSQTGPSRAQWLDDAHQWMIANQASIMAAFYFDRPATTGDNGCVFPLSSSADVSALTGIVDDTAHFVG